MSYFLKRHTAELYPPLRISEQVIHFMRTETFNRDENAPNSLYLLSIIVMIQDYRPSEKDPNSDAKFIRKFQSISISEWKPLPLLQEWPDFVLKIIGLPGFGRSSLRTND